MIILVNNLFSRFPLRTNLCLLSCCFSRVKEGETKKGSNNVKLKIILVGSAALFNAVAVVVPAEAPVLLLRLRVDLSLLIDFESSVAVVVVRFVLLDLVESIEPVRTRCIRRLAITLAVAFAAMIAFRSTVAVVLRTKSKHLAQC